MKLSLSIRFAGGPAFSGEFGGESGGRNPDNNRDDGTFPIFQPATPALLPPIRPRISAIEFIFKHLTQKSLRRPIPSASLFMAFFSSHLACIVCLQLLLALIQNRIE
jgi:hypothetical protein